MKRSMNPVAENKAESGVFSLLMAVYLYVMIGWLEQSHTEQLQAYICRKECQVLIREVGQHCQLSPECFKQWPSSECFRCIPRRSTSQNYHLKNSNLACKLVTDTCESARPFSLSCFHRGNRCQPLTAALPVHTRCHPQR